MLNLIRHFLNPLDQTSQVCRSTEAMVSGLLRVAVEGKKAVLLVFRQKNWK